MERISFKEDAFDPVSHSKIIAEQKISALNEVHVVQHAIESDHLAPLFNILAGQMVGIFGII